MNVIGQGSRVSNWNVQSCYQLCSPLPELNNAIQLKASNQGEDLSLLAYNGPYSFSYPYDLLIFESLHVAECHSNGGDCHYYSNYLGNLRFSQDDHRFDIRLSRCYSSRDLEIHVQIGALNIPPQEINTEGCFLSVMVNRDPYLHAYLVNMTQLQGSSVNIAQILLGQYFLCAGQTVQILNQLDYDYKSIAVALANVYNLGDYQLSAIFNCAQVAADETAEILKQMYLVDADSAANALQYAGYSAADILAALATIYGV